MKSTTALRIRFLFSEQCTMLCYISNSHDKITFIEKQWVLMTFHAKCKSCKQWQCSIWTTPCASHIGSSFYMLLIVHVENYCWYRLVNTPWKPRVMLDRWPDITENPNISRISVRWAPVNIHPCIGNCIKSLNEYSL